MAQFRVSQDELWPVYVLVSEEIASAYEKRHEPLVEVPHELYQQFTRVNSEFHHVRGEIAKLYYAAKKEQ